MLRAVCFMLCVLFISIGKQGHGPGSLDGSCQFSLMPRTHAGAFARQDFLVNISKTTDRINILIIHFTNIINAEMASFVLFNLFGHFI